MLVDFLLLFWQESGQWTETGFGNLPNWAIFGVFDAGERAGLFYILNVSDRRHGLYYFCRCNHPICMCTFDSPAILAVNFKRALSPIEVLVPDAKEGASCQTFF